MASERASGPLMAIGGGEDKEGKMAVLREFVRLAGGPNDARIVVLSAASTVPEEQDATYRAAFERLGVRDFRMLETNSRAEAETGHAAAVVARASGLYFTGGDQRRLVNHLRKTKVGDELHQAHARGAVIAGTSAGASMLSATMMDEGDSAECPREGLVTLAEGMGFLPGLIIDQHFAQRGRLGRLLAAVADRPALLGIGIGEDTAMIVEGDTFRVVGRGVTTVLDASLASQSEPRSRRRDEPITMSGVVLHTVAPGWVFDLGSRRVSPEPGGSKVEGRR